MESPEIILSFPTFEAHNFDDFRHFTSEDIPSLIRYFNSGHLEIFLNQEQKHKIIDDLKDLKIQEQPQSIVSDMKLAKGLSKILSLNLPRNWESELALRLILEEKFSDFQLDDKQIVNKDILKFLNFVNGLENLNKNNSKSGSDDYNEKEDFEKKIMTLLKMQSVKDFYEEKKKVITKHFPSALRQLKTLGKKESPKHEENKGDYKTNSKTDSQKESSLYQILKSHFDRKTYPKSVPPQGEDKNKFKEPEKYLCFNPYYIQNDKDHKYYTDEVNFYLKHISKEVFFESLHKNFPLLCKTKKGFVLSLLTMRGFKKFVRDQLKELPGKDKELEGLDRYIKFNDDELIEEIKKLRKGVT